MKIVVERHPDGFVAYPLGLKGVVVKSHGSADALAFKFALHKAYTEASHGVLERIAQRMAAMPARDAGAPLAGADLIVAPDV